MPGRNQVEQASRSGSKPRRSRKKKTGRGAACPWQNARKRPRSDIGPRRGSNNGLNWDSFDASTAALPKTSD